ncbi:NAD-dependent epimerase/dehydratase family protein [Sediminibacillus albus]|uniref:UDP-glucose 4-epimerase n=1 Tax=Sediminibacillus albus TaxID=407036 RepID=A0A1G9CCK5_9BACI|nr:NAD-dependent epimerase/dehydratase family protein [Sediminibacillus albus]SDK49389.1 UDP-glucose 4-epimerase [Sediminibacillus albus]
MSYGNVLITGGAGFVGSQLIAGLLPKADHIYVIDDLSTGNILSIPSSDKISFYQTSIIDEETLNTVLPKVDYIFHLACRNLLLSVEDMEADFHTNLYGGFLLLQKTKELNPNIKRFIYTSTASVYNNADILPTPEHYYNISLPYAASKFSMEHYCHVYQSISQLPVTILRLSNLYGPGQLAANPYCGVVAKFFDSAMKKQPLVIYGDGEQTRDFTYIKDGIQAILLAATHPAAVGNVYNVGTGKETKISLLAELIMDVTKESTEIHFAPERMIDTVRNRCLDAGKIESELNWEPQFSLREGLTKTHHWITEGVSG